MNLYISDTHFGHASVIVMDHRPFSDVHEMDEYLIARWNDRVYPDDDVWFLGDFAFRSEIPPQDYLKRLKGKKHLIVGNHDGKMLKNSIAMRYFETVDDLLTITDGNEQVVLCHYPLAEWPHYFRNAWHIYGHVHNNMNDAEKFMLTQKRAVNAGCMLNGWVPCSLRELISNKMERIKNLHPEPADKT